MRDFVVVETRFTGRQVIFFERSSITQVAFDNQGVTIGLGSSRLSFPFVKPVSSNIVNEFLRSLFGEEIALRMAAIKVTMGRYFNPAAIACLDYSSGAVCVYMKAGNMTQLPSCTLDAYRNMVTAIFGVEAGELVKALPPPIPVAAAPKAQRPPKLPSYEEQRQATIDAVTAPKKAPGVLSIANKDFGVTTTTSPVVVGNLLDDVCMQLWQVANALRGSEGLRDEKWAFMPKSVECCMAQLQYLVGPLMQGVVVEGDLARVPAIATELVSMESQLPRSEKELRAAISNQAKRLQLVRVPFGDVGTRTKGSHAAAA